MALVSAPSSPAVLVPLTGAESDYDALMGRIADSRVVLIGEATHGTYEFYRERARITRRLIGEKGFAAVAVEADWPDAYRANRYVRGATTDASATAALGGFSRFPRWMWRNTVVAEFLEWLRGWNDVNSGRACGFYGLDLYSLSSSIDAVLGYLDEVDPAAAAIARRRYGCFGRFLDDHAEYGYAVTFGLTARCEEEATRLLSDLMCTSAAELRRDGLHAEDEAFFAEQNARLVISAEAYYRAMFARHVDSWNLRDSHMADTLNRLLIHLERTGRPPKAVVWEHNSHVGDARATELGRGGELNVGQLARETYGRDAFNIGFTTFDGEVTAASDWDRPAERKRVRPALPESYELLLHETAAELAVPAFVFDPTDEVAALPGQRLERAIGVVYRPDTERQSHYFLASLANQFDAVIHIDRTTALEPLDRDDGWHGGEPPETYPTGQ